MRRGRPPLPRAVFAFEDPAVELPQEGLVLDTSFVVEALLPNQPFHQECADFLERCADEATLVFYSRLLEVELFETAFFVALKERWGSKTKGREKRLDGRARRRAARLQQELMVAWRDILRAVIWAPIEVSEVLSEVSWLMRFGLRSYDAVHVATAVYADAPALVTIDKDFALVPERLLDLYVPDKLVSSFRSLRKRITLRL